MIKFCNQCGHPVDFLVPAGDSLPRHVCPQCAHIQYGNPRLILGCVAEYQGKILLCKRAIEPRLGYWTLPAGFMENNETTQQGAARESLEEACAQVSLDAPFALISIAGIHQVHLFYRGQMAKPDFAAGDESLAVDLFAEHEIPWNELAFLSVRYCLERYLEDRRKGSFQFHETELVPT